MSQSSVHLSERVRCGYFVVNEVLSRILFCLDSKPAVNLFDDDDDEDDDGDIFKQMSSRTAAENPASVAAKHKVCLLMSL